MSTLRTTVAVCVACLLAAPALAQIAPIETPAARTSADAMAATTQTATPAYRPISPVAGANIFATLKASGQFTTLLKALDATNLSSLVQSQPNITLLAPTDAAFDALPPGELDMLMKSENLAQLQAILTYHLIATRVAPAQVHGHAPGKVPTAAQKSVVIDGSGSTMKVNEVAVLQEGVPASNGLIYVVGKVLTPPA